MTDLNKLTFGFEQTFTIPEWWTEVGFTHVSDTPLKREKMLSLAKELVEITKGSYKESLDIYKHLQYETFLINGEESFVITMDPGSIEVKTPPVHSEQVEAILIPLFEAAYKAGLVPYRQWWYGVKGGTEGGCHVNIGAKTKKENVFLNNPMLLLKYFSVLHNHPFLHYPFMGVDVGPGGNAQRMDEKSDFRKVQNRFNKAAELHQKGEFDFKKLWSLFKDTSLITEKSSAPSLAKLTAPNFVLEDRAQEALREPSEVKLIIDLKLALLKYADELNEDLVLKKFGKELHSYMLTSFYLWEKFQYFCNTININPVMYQIFFDRQFPILFQGKNPPANFRLKEGRRPRKILSEEKKNGIVVSKKVDTRYKRFEVYFVTNDIDKNEYDLLVEGKGIENTFKLYEHKGYLNFGEVGQVHYGYIDIKINESSPLLSFEFINRTTKETLEKTSFHLMDMQWL